MPAGLRIGSRSQGTIAMHNRTTARPNRVRATFRDATMIAFDLAGDATLGQLAETIGKLAQRHGGLFLPVYVRLEPARR